MTAACVLPKLLVGKPQSRGVLLVKVLCPVVNLLNPCLEFLALGGSDLQVLHKCLELSLVDGAVVVLDHPC